jgi:hypothetical protein
MASFKHHSHTGPQIQAGQKSRILPLRETAGEHRGNAMTSFAVSPRTIVSALAISAAMCGQAGAATLAEGFDTVTPGGWTVVNNSAPVGLTNWFQGNNAVFPAQSGAATSYAGANYNNTTGAGNISDWLITPTLIFNNGDSLSFYTRTVDTPTFADNLEVRFSDVGGTNVGGTAASVGDFTTLLLSVNPGLSSAGYPNTWTEYTATISGLSGPTSGAIGFRYFVTNGGPSGSNSDYIGIDTVTITAVPEPETYAMMGLGLALLGSLARRRKNKNGA